MPRKAAAEKEQLSDDHRRSASGGLTPRDDPPPTDVSAGKLTSKEIDTVLSLLSKEPDEDTRSELRSMIFGVPGTPLDLIEAQKRAAAKRSAVATPKATPSMRSKILT